jgi:hypothetical protein
MQGELENSTSNEQLPLTTVSFSQKFEVITWNMDYVGI